MGKRGFYCTKMKHDVGYTSPVYGATHVVNI
jgi:hypothetical protein